MRLLPRLQTLRSAAVGLTATATILGLASLPWRLAVTSGPAPVRFDDLLVRACAGALLICLLWAWLAVMAVVVESLGAPAPTAAAPLALPAPVRRLVLSLCGVALTVSATPALAAPGTDAGGAADRAAVPALIAGLPFPDRAMDGDVPTAATPPASRTTHRATRRAARRESGKVVTVAWGDSLWSITARRLGASSDAEIDHGWRELYAANRELIGNDPALITPGMRLEVPGSLR